MASPLKSKAQGTAQPTAPNLIVLDYLEKRAREVYAQELEQDESVWQALPFFAAGIGFELTFLGAAGGLVPPRIEPYSILLCFLVGIAAVLVVTSGYYLGVASWPRKYQRHPHQKDLCDWADSLRSHYVSLGLVGDALENAILLDLRTFVTTETSAAATQNAQVNFKKVYGRGRATVFFLMAAAVSFCLATAIFVHDRAMPALKGLSKPAMTAPAKPSAPAPGTAASPKMTTPAAASQAKPPPPARVMIIEHATKVVLPAGARVELPSGK